MIKNERSQLVQRLAEELRNGWVSLAIGEEAASELERLEDMVNELGRLALSAPSAMARKLSKEAEASALKDFEEYFLQNYPPDCILHKPAWHAPKIFRAALYAIDAQMRATDGGGV